VRRATADRIVLAAGSFGTPAILQRSGIGDADYLRTILPEGTALHHLPGVGQNLWEQPGLSVDFDPADGAYARLAPLVPKVGMFGSVVCKVMSEPDLEWFDTHLFQRHVMAPPPFPGLSFAGCQIFLLDPAESGFTRITSDDPEAKPEIAGGAGHPRDVERLARVIEMEREIMASPELREWVGAEMKPGAAIQGEELRRWVYDNLELYHHACGTAKLGPAGDPLAVAGADARVHGFDNLFVGDASAIPHIPRAAVHMPVLGIAEKVSDLIRGR
jgi:choline dehydrogenase